MQKNYVIDTNVLIEDEECIKILRNGEENNIFIPWIVLRELDGLKKDSKLKSRAIRAIKQINEHKDWITILDNCKYDNNLTYDEMILEEVKIHNNTKKYVLVTNDEMLQFRAHKNNILCEKYETSIPFKVESQKYTGFIRTEDEKIANSFFWKEGKLYNYTRHGEKQIDYENEVWNIKPRSPYQNAAIELMLNNDIKLVTIQSDAGFGKSYITLATALYLTLEKKLFDKIYVVKPNIEIGEKLGFLPGDISDKLTPYYRAIHDLIIKLHDLRPANRLFKGNEKEENFDIFSLKSLNYRKIEYIPINFMRGMNIDNSFVIIDEVQNLSRAELRTVLSRMGEGTKCVCLGDVNQVDNIFLNSENNGLNWLVKLMKNDWEFGHVVLKGTKSRGPIADLVRKCKL